MGYKLGQGAGATCNAVVTWSGSGKSLCASSWRRGSLSSHTRGVRHGVAV